MHEMAADVFVRNLDFKIDRAPAERGFDIAAETGEGRFADNLGNAFADDRFASQAEALGITVIDELVS